MMKELLNLTISTGGVTVFLLLTVLLFALLRWLRRLVILVPMSKARQRTVNRGILVSETVVVLVFLLTSIPLLVLKGDPAYTPIFFGILILGVIWVSWFVIRDAVAGLFIKAGEVVRLGDRVEIDGASGRLTRLGYRVFELETSEGEQVVVPFSRLSQQAVSRTPAIDNVFRYSFRLPRPPSALAETYDRIRRTALNHHWSSLARDPQIELQGMELVVTVFSLDAVHGPAIEAAVRVAGLPDPAG